MELTIKQKFMLLIAIPLVAIGMYVILGWWALNSLSGETRHILHDEVSPLVSEDITELNALQGSIQLMLEADRDVHQALLAERAMLVASEESEIKKAVASSDENIGQARERMDKASKVFKDEEVTLYNDFLNTFSTWVEKTRKVVTLARDPDQFKFATRISYGSAAESFGSMRSIIDQLTGMMQKRISAVMNRVKDKGAEIEKDSTEMEEDSQKIIWAFIGIALVFVLAIMVSGVLLSQSITRPIGQAVSKLSEVASVTASASSEVATSSQTLAEGASEQAASLEETSATLEEVSTMSRRNSEHTHEASGMAKEMRNLASQGSSSMERMRTAIDEIKGSSDQTAKIIKTIDEIAFQTNLLALNAAVEAARAGDAGRGFAVVAEEVRNLAMRSAEAAKDTNAIIEDSQNKANQGVQVATEVGAVLDQLVSSAEKVESLVAQVTSASAEQTQSINQVASGMSQMESLTQSNAATAEQTAAASDELSAQSQELILVVERLTTMIGSAIRANVQTGVGNLPRRETPLLGGASDEDEDVKKERKANMSAA